MSLVIPTYNEADNIGPILARVRDVLDGLHHDYEIVVVDDDSPDRTWHRVEAEARTDDRIRLIRRLDHRGLSSAILDGLAAARGSVLAVIDADLQHDEAVLPALIADVATGQADICIGSRGAVGGSYGSFGPLRRALSFAGAEVARALLGVSISDPMSGFFALSRERYEAVAHLVDPRGFKLLLDLVATGPRPRVTEVGYRFRARRRGETKLSPRVIGSSLASMAGLAVRRGRPATFTTYVTVAIAALSARLAATSVLTAAGAGSLLTVAVIEAAILAEYGTHRRLTFRTPSGIAPGGAGSLIRFHLVAANGLLAQAGLGLAVDSRIADPLASSPIGGIDLVSVFAIATFGMVVVISLTYHLNRLLTWPDRHLTAGCSSGPIVAPTSSPISSTARR